MLYPIFYSFFIIATVVFGGVYLAGPFTIRHIAVAMMVFYASLHKKSMPKEKTMTAYILFVIVFGISSVGYGYTDEFFKVLIANYLVCYVSFWATVILIEKEKSFVAFIYTFTFIGVISGILVVLQYNNVNWAFMVPNLLRTFTLEDMEQLSSFGGLISGQSLPGLFNRVDNGYYLAVATILSSYLYCRKRKLKLLIVWAFLLVSLYMVQQRAALFIGLLLSIIFFHNVLTASHKKIIYAVIFIGALVFILQDMELTSLIKESRYSKWADTGTRQDLWQFSYDYIVNHPFDANLYDFSKKHPDTSAHNLFLNAFLSCGLIGGCLIIYIIVVLCYRCLKVFVNRKFVLPDYYLAALGFLAFNFISLTHNNSVVNGNIVFWILATPLMIKVYNKKQM